MRRALVLSAAVLVLAAGCGGGDAAPAGELAGTLAYFPATSTLAIVSTDLESEQFEELDRIARRRFGQGVETFLEQAVESDEDLSWEDDVRPQLGGELVVGTTNLPGLDDGDGDGGMVIVFRAQDGDKIAGWDRLEPSGEASGAKLFRDRETEELLAIDGDVLVAASDEEMLRAALARPDSSDRLTGERFDAALADLPDDALVRIYGDTAELLESEDVAPFRALPWVAALRSFGVAVSFDAGNVVTDFALTTDPDGLNERELPLATGSEAPEVFDREGDIVGGNRNQSLTTAFLFRLAELRFPDSRFVRDVHALEQELDIDFVQEVLRQFDGPSASAVSPDGQTFAARSAVRDPEGLERLLPRLAPHLPRLVVGLEGLQAEGQALLFLFAPDALVLQSERVEVDRVGDLWRVRGLTGEGPDQLFFGVLGDVFVVASDPDLARRVAEEDTVPVDGARGAGLLRANVAGRAEQLERLLPFGIGATGEVVAWLEASVERLRGQARVEVG
jgi:hypothetical protein